MIYAWLIEFRKLAKADVPRYLGRNTYDCLGSVADPFKAIRFARREDAQAYIDCEKLTDATAIEHGFDEVESDRG